MIVIIRHELGISSNRFSSRNDDCVPGFCTHRPSLLPIGSNGENIGFEFNGRETFC